VYRAGTEPGGKCGIGQLVTTRPARPGCASGLLPPSPPAEKATARQDQARKASAGDGAGDGDRGQTLPDVVELASKLPSRRRARLELFTGARWLCGRDERRLGRTYGLAVVLNGSLGGFKPGSCNLKKDFALSLGMGSPSPTETFLRILVILPS
jgi:hypothetical protein